MTILIILAKIAFVFVVFCIGVVVGGKAMCHRFLEHLDIALHASSLTDEQRVEIAELLLEQVEKKNR